MYAILARYPSGTLHTYSSTYESLASARRSRDNIAGYSDGQYDPELFIIVPDRVWMVTRREVAHDSYKYDSCHADESYARELAEFCEYETGVVAVVTVVECGA